MLEKCGRSGQIPHNADAVHSARGVGLSTQTPASAMLMSPHTAHEGTATDSLHKTDLIFSSLASDTNCIKLSLKGENSLTLSD